MSPCVPDAVYAIGDIHGMADLLERLQARIAADAQARGYLHPKVVYLGDYVDRGPDSRRVFDLVLSGLPEFMRVRLRGNHEDMLATYLVNPWDTDNAQTWYRHGGKQTLQSYGIESSKVGFSIDCVSLSRTLMQAMPAEHRRLVLEGHGSLELVHQDDWAIYVHAGLNPARQLEAQSLDDLLWRRDHPGDWGKPVVHGHTITMHGPQVSRTQINVDTGAFAEGVLSCVCLDGHSVRPMAVSDARPWRIMVDPECLGDAVWVDWVLDAVRSTSADKPVLGLCMGLRSPAIAAQAASLGIATKDVDYQGLLGLLANPGSSLSRSIDSNRVSLMFSTSPAMRQLENAVTQLVKAAPAHVLDAGELYAGLVLGD